MSKIHETDKNGSDLFNTFWMAGSGHEEDELQEEEEQEEEEEEEEEDEEEPKEVWVELCKMMEALENMKNYTIVRHSRV